MTERLAIIDVPHKARQFFDAAPEWFVDGHEGNLNVVRGFVQVLKKMVTKSPFTHLIAAFDSDFSSRKILFPEYKSDRDEKPPGYVRQLGFLRQVFEIFEVPVLEQDGFEADDVIATLCHRLRGNDIEVTMISEDKDLWQLLRKNVKQSRRGELFGVDDLRKRHGIYPWQVVDFLTLVGGKDCVDGVDGIGEKTATTFLANNGSIDMAIARLAGLQYDAFSDGLLPGITAKKQESLVASLPRLVHMRDIVRLRTNLPLKRVYAQSKISLMTESGFWNKFTTK